MDEHEANINYMEMEEKWKKRDPNYIIHGKREFNITHIQKGNGKLKPIEQFVRDEKLNKLGL